MNESILIEPHEASYGNFRALLLSAAVLVLALLVGVRYGPLAALVVGIFAAVIPYWNYERALMAFIAATLLWPYSLAWEVGPFLLGPSRALLVLLIATFVIFLSRRELRIKRTPLDLPILAFVTVMLLSIVMNVEAMNSDQINRALKTLGYSVIEWILLFYIVVSIAYNINRCRRIVTYVTILLSIVALVGIVEFIFDFRFYEWFKQYLPGGDEMTSNIHEALLQRKAASFYRGGILRIVSTTISVHEVGTMMAMAIPLLLFYLSYARDWGKRWLILVALSISVFALFLTVTRGALIAVGVAVLVQSIFSSRHMLRMGVILAASIIALVSIFYPALLNAVYSVSNPEALESEASYQGRLLDWPEAAKVLQGRDFFGVGLAQVSKHKLAYGTEIKETFEVTDNYYLSAVVEMGIIGLGSLLALWLTVFSVLTRRKSLPGMRGLETRDLRVALLAAASAFMVMCFTFDALVFMTVSKLFWLVLGLAVALALAEKEEARNVDHATA